MDEPTKTPAEMTDEELDAYLSGEELVEKPVDPVPEDKETPEEEEEKPEDKEEEPEKEEPEVPQEEPEEKPSRRQQLRINQLLEKLKESGKTPEEQEPSQPTKPTGIKYEEELDADEDVIKNLNDDREKFGQEMYQQGLAQANALKQQQDAFEFRHMLTQEEPIVLQKYPFMDKDSDQYDEQYAAAMVEKYFDDIQFDANTRTARRPVSYLEYVESQMEFAAALAEKMARESHENVVKQAANTGLRPSGSSPSKGVNLNKAPEDMTDEELDAAIASIRR